MRSVIMIPARYASTRFPGKALADIRGATGETATLIERTINAARAADGAHDLIVATDDQRIADVARRAGVRAAMTPEDCRNGTERCAAVLSAGEVEASIVINLQGDALLTPPHAITALIEALRDSPDISVVTPMIRCSPETAARLRTDEGAGRIGGTSVVCNGMGDALYFSKRLIPHGAGGEDCPFFLHLGVYGYRANALRSYAEAPPCAIETAEGLEQLRFLHLGRAIRMVEIAEPEGGLWEVNNPEDIPIVERTLALRGLA